MLRQVAITQNPPKFCYFPHLLTTIIKHRLSEMFEKYMKIYNKKKDNWKLSNKTVEFKRLTYNFWWLKPISLNIANPALNLLIDFSSVLSLWKQQRLYKSLWWGSHRTSRGFVGGSSRPLVVLATCHWYWQNRKQAGFRTCTSGADEIAVWAGTATLFLWRLEVHRLLSTV